jgi:hypothetical protein
VRDLLATIAERALAPGGPPLTIADATWPGLLDQLERERALGLARQAACTGSLVLSEGQRQELDQRVNAWLDLGLRLDALALAAHAVLVQAGIEHRFLKGLVYARSLYPNVGLRHYADVDVLVAGADLGAAVAALARGLGARRLAPERRAGFDRRFAKDLPLQVDGLELDLHRTLVPGPWGQRLDAELLLADRADVVVGGVALPALSGRLQTAHAILTARLGDARPRLATLLDERLATAAIPLDLELITRAGLDLGSVRGPRPWLARHPRLRDVSTVLAVGGTRSRLHFLHGQLWPGRAYRRFRRSLTSA